MPVSESQKKMIRALDSKEPLTKWRDWRWQLRHAVSDLHTVEKMLEVKFSDEMHRRFEDTASKFPMSVTPYYLSLISPENPESDPVFLQSLPSPSELQLMKGDMADPLHEDHDSPAPCITHRYPDRVLLLVSNVCSMYCRHCTRKRKVGDEDSVPSKEEMLKGIEYIKNTPHVRDVLLSGGDPFLLSDERLDWILTELGKIDHVEFVRIGTRTPVVLPYRITDSLCSMLKKHHPLWINTHFNHPKEMTQSSREALSKLANAGIPLGNQTVLLAGINDCPRIIRELNHKLVANRVRPYYLYQCDLSEGLSHFRTPVGKGIQIMESLIGHTSGLCVPTYIIDAPGGGGKIPVMPNYLISWSTNKVVLRNYEGVITTYKEPDSYEPGFCDRDCDNCQKHLDLGDGDERKAVGIERLLADHDETIYLVPSDNERLDRRN